MKKIALISLLTIILFSCKKSIIGTKVFFTGDVRDETTNLPIQDIRIILKGSNSGLWGGGTVDVLLETTTDQNGEFIFDERVNLGNYDRYTIKAQYDYMSSDTTGRAYDYFFDELSNSKNIEYADNINSLPTNIHFYLVPKGVISFFCANSEDYDKILIDTPFNHNGIQYKNYLELSFPPNKTYSFTFYGIVNGQIQQTQTKDIYIPNYSDNYSPLFYHIVLE